MRMHQGRRRWIAAAGCAVLLVAATACGTDAKIATSEFAGQDAAAISAAAHAAIEEITTVRVTGTITEGATRLAVDMQVSRKGSCLGKIEQGPGVIEIRQNTVGTWVRSDRATLEESAAPEMTEAEIEDALGKWSTTTGAHPLCDLDYWLDTFSIAPEGTDAEGRPLVVGDEVRLTGIRAVELIAETADRNSTKKAFVASVPPHYLLKVSNDDPQTSANLVFSDFGDEFVVQEPPDEVLLGN